MGLLGDVVNVGSLGLIPDITGEKAAAEAAGIGSRANLAAEARLDLKRDRTIKYLLDTVR